MRTQTIILVISLALLFCGTAQSISWQERRLIIREYSQIRREIGAKAANEIFCTRPMTMKELEKAKVIIEMCTDPNNMNLCGAGTAGLVMKCKMEKMLKRQAFQNRWSQG